MNNKYDELIKKEEKAIDTRCDTIIEKAISQAISDDRNYFIIETYSQNYRRVISKCKSCGFLNYEYKNLHGNKRHRFYFREFKEAKEEIGKHKKKIEKDKIDNKKKKLKSDIIFYIGLTSIVAIAVYFLNYDVCIS